MPNDKRLGTDRFSRDKQTKDEAEESLMETNDLEAIKPKPPVGRPRTIKRDISKSSQEGLPDNWTRATFIVREDLLEKIKDCAYTERISIKDLVNEAFENYLDGKEIISRKG